MKSTNFIAAIVIALSFIACNKEKAEPDPVDSNGPAGTFQAIRSGSFQAQNGYNAEGTAQLGTDDNAAQWLRLAQDFNASLSTGAVTVYLSKNQNLALGTPSSFVRLGLVTIQGEHFYKVDPAVGNDFKFAILWCASAGVQFGNATLN